MTVWNSPMQSMTWEEDHTNRAAAGTGSPVDGTWYEITNYSGVGRLMAIGLYAITTETAELKITTDGNAHTILKGSLAASNATYSVSNMFVGDTAKTYSFPFSLEFISTLVIEYRRDGDTNDIAGWASYGILSEELKREIIPAGQPVPDRYGNPRPRVYDEDIMLVWFCHGKDGLGNPHGISNKVEHLPSKRVETSISSDGTVTGKLKKAAYCLSVKGNRVTWSDTTEDTETVIAVDEEMYKVPIKNGQIDNQYLPKAKVKEVKDATKALP